MNPDEATKLCIEALREKWVAETPTHEPYDGDDERASRREAERVEAWWNEASARALESGDLRIVSRQRIVSGSRLRALEEAANELRQRLNHTSRCSYSNRMSSGPDSDFCSCGLREAKRAIAELDALDKEATT